MSTSIMTSSKSVTSQSIFGNCPQCEGLVKISAKLKPSHTVECPHCNHQFQLNQMNDLAVPELKVVAGESQSPSPASTKANSTPIPVVDRDLYDEQGNVRKKYTVPPQLAKGAKRGRNRSHRKLNARFEPRVDPSLETNADPPEAYQVNIGDDSQTGQIGQPAWQTPDSSDSIPAFTSIPKGGTESSENPTIPPNQRNPQAAQRPSKQLHRSTTNHRRRRRPSSRTSDLMETIKVVIGGMLAVPLAYLIVMWFLGQDPLRIAPTIEQYAPFAVPQKMRGEPNRKAKPGKDSTESFIDATPQQEAENDPSSLLDNLQFPDFYDYPDFQPLPESNVPRE